MDFAAIQHRLTTIFLVVSTTLASSLSPVLPPSPPVSTLQSPETIRMANLDPQQIVLSYPMASSGAIMSSPTVLAAIDTVQPTPTDQPTATPTPTIPQPTPTEIPEITTAAGQSALLNIPAASGNSPANSLNPDLIFGLINDHRKELGLPAFEKDEQLCKLAEYRGPQLNNEIFVTGQVHKGLYDLNLPYWITENMAGYASEQANFDWWMGSYIHRKAIEGNFKYSCGICNGRACAQLFTSYIQK